MEEKRGVARSRNRYPVRETCAGYGGEGSTRAGLLPGSSPAASRARADVPRTRLVRQMPFVKTGAHNAAQFKQWVRRCQLPTQVWFTRHPELGTANILNDSHLRAMALARMSPAQVRAWLQRL